MSLFSLCAMGDVKALISHQMLGTEDTTTVSDLLGKNVVSNLELDLGQVHEFLLKQFV